MGDKMTDFDFYPNQFRAANTEQGSFRSFSHGFYDYSGILGASARLMEGEEVEIHICDHHNNGNQTHHVMRMHIRESQIEGTDTELAFSLDADPVSRLCDGDPVTIGTSVGLVLGRLAALKKASIFLQPTAEDIKILNTDYP